MTMTSIERMLRPLRQEKPDRMPVKIHHQQQHHLEKYMGGVNALTAFAQIGMDTSIREK
jgi:hypothetical protein